MEIGMLLASSPENGMMTILTFVVAQGLIAVGGIVSHIVRMRVMEAEIKELKLENTGLRDVVQVLTSTVSSLTTEVAVLKNETVNLQREISHLRQDGRSI